MMNERESSDAKLSNQHKPTGSTSCDYYTNSTNIKTKTSVHYKPTTYQSTIM